MNGFLKIMVLSHYFIYGLVNGVPKSYLLLQLGFIIWRPPNQFCRPRS
jgi:hypothetical protein